MTVCDFSGAGPVAVCASMAGAAKAIEPGMIKIIRRNSVSILYLELGSLKFFMALIRPATGGSFAKARVGVLASAVASADCMFSAR